MSHNFTNTEMLDFIREELTAARSSAKQAQLRGYSDQFDMGRITTLAFLVSTFDRAISDATTFVAEMIDLTDVPEYVETGGDPA